MSKTTETNSRTIGKCVLPPWRRNQNSLPIARSWTLSTEGSIDYRERMFAFRVSHVGDSKHAPQFSSVHFHRPGLRRGAGRRLRERGRHRGVKGQVTLGLFHHLVNMAV